MAERPLIVNADDFGLTERTSSGIMRAHREGIVTSTSVLCLTPSFEATVKTLADSIDVGVHLALVGEDPPLLPSHAVPSLAPKGRLPFSWRTFLLRSAAGRIDPAEIEKELSAQIDRVTTAWPAITHLDCHQHLQLWPSVGRVVVRLAEKLGVPIRIPRSRSGGPRGAGVRLLASKLEQTASKQQVGFPRDFAGLDEAGHMSLDTLRSAVVALSRSGADAAEIGVHPGEDTDPARYRYRWGYEWGAELQALISADSKKVVQESGFRLARRAEVFA